MSVGAALAYQGEAADDTVWLIGGSIGYENLELDSESDVANSSTSESEFLSGSAFVTASTTPSAGKSENPAQYSFTASYTYGDGDQDYERRFEADFQPVFGGDIETATDRLASSIGQSYQTASLQASVTKPLGNLLFTPRVGLSYTRFETDGHAENNVDGADNGLALEYEASEDEWLEGRVGASVVALFGMSESATLEIGASADAVFVEDAETPVRVAYFQQDLRPQTERAALLYNVDDLDTEFYDLGLSVAAQFSNGFRPYAAIYTREGHDYISSKGAVFGFKSTF